jgi:hypothetical protein
MPDVWHAGPPLHFDLTAALFDRQRSARAVISDRFAFADLQQQRR